MNRRPTVAEYVVARLAALGIRHAFGVPGDYTFPFDDALEASTEITSVLSANELNAAYAADGYARVAGAGVLCTTYGVGELSALNGVMGSFAEYVPVFHLVGQPSLRLQRSGRITHHSLGDGVFGNFRALSTAATCVSADLTPSNAIAEMERVIATALRQCRPAYITAAHDVALMPIEGDPPSPRTLADGLTGSSVPDELAAALEAVRIRLAKARAPLAMLSYRLARHRLQPQIRAFLEACGMGYVTLPMDKGVLSESHPNFVGPYSGMSSAQAVIDAVEAADLIVEIGGICRADFNTMMWTAREHPEITIELFPEHVRVGGKSYGPVWLGDLLTALRDNPPTFVRPPAARPNWRPLEGTGDDPVTLGGFLSRFQRFLREGDVVVAETGYSASGSIPSLSFPPDAQYHNQVLWGSIGWATPAAFGTSLADPSRRTLLVTGDGSHQLSANEIGAMGHHGAKPIIFVINNGSFGVEEALSREQGHAYDVLAPWNYAALPAAMGCSDWLTARVETVGQLEAALERAANGERAAYLEIVTGPAGVPSPFPRPVLQSLYRTEPG